MKFEKVLAALLVIIALAPMSSDAEATEEGPGVAVGIGLLSDKGIGGLGLDYPVTPGGYAGISVGASFGYRF